MFVLEDFHSPAPTHRSETYSFVTVVDHFIAFLTIHSLVIPLDSSWIMFGLTDMLGGTFSYTQQKNAML